jgi:hypothetical protein
MGAVSPTVPSNDPLNRNLSVEELTADYQNAIGSSTSSLAYFAIKGDENMPLRLREALWRDRSQLYSAYKSGTKLRNEAEKKVLRICEFADWRDEQIAQGEDEDQYQSMMSQVEQLESESFRDGDGSMLSQSDPFP